MTDPGPWTCSHTARSPAMAVDLPVPAGPTRTSRTRPEVAIFSTARAWSTLSSVVAPGQVRLCHLGHDGDAHPGCSELPRGFEEARLCAEKRLGRVDDAALGMKPRRPVGADVALRCVVKRWRGEHHGAGDGELGDVLGDGHPVIRRGEADPVQACGGPRPEGSGVRRWNGARRRW